MEGLSLGLAQRLFGCGDVFDDLRLEGFEVGESPPGRRKLTNSTLRSFPYKSPWNPSR